MLFLTGSICASISRSAQTGGVEDTDDRGPKAVVDHSHSVELLQANSSNMSEEPETQRKRRGWGWGEVGLVLGRSKTDFS